jgi:hypothetical protein
VRSLLVASSAALALLAGCKVGVSADAGLREPLIVEGGQFIPGDLPVSDAGPSGVLVNSLGAVVHAGQAGVALTGDVGPGSYSTLMRFADLGTGYWSVPVGVPDPQMPGSLTWAATLDFGWNIPPGIHNMLFAAMDQEGRAGPPVMNPYTVEAYAPMGKLVISLAWDSAADLDLHVTTPSGFDLNPKAPTTSPDGGAKPPPGTGLINRDSNAACVQDNFREEDAYWMDGPPSGTYLIHVDMFSACTASAAQFVVTVHQNGKVTHTIPGRLLAMDADSGGPGLFVLQLNL